MINTTKAGMILFMVSALCSYLDKSWSRVVLVINFTTLFYTDFAKSINRSVDMTDL